MGTFWAWILSILLSFGAGAAAGRSYQPDTELEQKIQGHMDVIVDEAAGIVDDVSQAARDRRETLESELEDSETYKKAEKFVNDVQEIADNTTADIDAHFGTGETETEAETQPEPETQPQV